MKTQVVTRLAFITAGLLWTSFAEAQWGTIKGEFEISNLPVGDHVFLIWHEKAGYVDRALQIKGKDGENVLPALDYPASLFQ